MAQSKKSYLQIMREKKDLTREVVAFESNIDTSTLYRIEQDPSNANPQIMNSIIDALDDEYVAYLYISQNPVAMRFIPEGVQQTSILQAVVKLRSAVKSLMADMNCLLDVAVDNEIDEEEMDLWLGCKEKIRNIVKAYIALECADGGER